MGFRPRKRAANQNARVYWQACETKRVLGLAGYKVGMTHIAHIDQSEAVTKGQEIVSAATVIEVPPMYVYGIRCYDDYNSIGDTLVKDENIMKKLNIKKSNPKAVDEQKVKNVKLLVFAQPDKTSIGKKHVECMEIGLGGKDAKEKLEYAKSMLGKEIRAKDVFKSGEFVDLIAITKGKGWQGAVKRFGTSIQRPKATGKRRHVGTLGQWHPAYVLYTAPQAGQMGYHKRTEFNKMVLKIGENATEVNPKGGFIGYGFVKNDYVLVKGSVPGPAKRLVKMRLGVRPVAPQKEQQISYISVESKQ
jgi:large subunit ribosomal protein L3